MTTDVLDMLLTKLGTTVDQIIPATIEYGLHTTRFYILICIAIILAGLIFIATGIILISNTDSDSLQFLAIALFIIGFVALGFSTVCLGMNLIDLHKWKTYPTMEAYQTILRWIGGSS